MCNPACLQFAISHLTPEEVADKKVIEVGSMNVNGSARSFLETLKPQSYLGVDLAEGPGVDRICDIADLYQRFGKDQFDLVISTELLEHVEDWRGAISNLKAVLKPGGALLITTRSRGFRYHGYPFDFWRYELSDLQAIFSDLQIEALEKDPLSPGVFVKARKPIEFIENDLGDYRLYSIIAKRRCVRVGDLQRRWYMAYRRWRLSIKRLKHGEGGRVNSISIL